ncbi:hypothetical protein [Streptomyces sp. TRM64462]|uniref:zinc finger domain-containing protein n=1 Tax=Streptomyces sp. TRM64462 TaxID=2741726 RepID=UPI001586A2B3|nr:hypothetical protein [Streptomyces sp. TRM64462]
MSTTFDVPKALLRSDGTGWTTVTASPDWWRYLADASNSRKLLEEIAAYGESRLNPTLCLALGASTHRPCRYPRHECPHHGPDNEQNRCQVIGKSGEPCRWNVVANGPCPNHDPSVPRTAPAPRRAGAGGTPPRQRRSPAPARAARPVVKPITVPCPHCRVEAGAKCRYPNGSETSIHRLRKKAAAERAAAESG